MRQPGSVPTSGCSSFSCFCSIRMVRPLVGAGPVTSVKLATVMVERTIDRPGRSKDHPADTGLGRGQAVVDPGQCLADILVRFGIRRTTRDQGQLLEGQGPKTHDCRLLVLLVCGIEPRVLGPGGLPDRVQRAPVGMRPREYRADGGKRPHTTLHLTQLRWIEFPHDIPP